MPPTAWAKGDRSFACLFEQDPAETTEWSDVVTADFPLDDRACIATTTYVPCDSPHEVERIATLVVNGAVESGQLRGHRALDAAGNLNLRRKQWAELDVVCQGYLDVVSHNPADGLTGVADTFPELYPDELGDYVIYCLAQSPFDTSPDDVVRSSGSVYDLSGFTLCCSRASGTRSARRSLRGRPGSRGPRTPGSRGRPAAVR